MNFQKSVLTIAIILLILALVVFGAMLYVNKVEYPPVDAQCPDYWIDMSGGMGTGGYCINTKNLGKGSCPSKMNFNTGMWTGDDGLCNKKKWAESCDLTWDGITNNNYACEDKNDEDADDLTQSAKDQDNSLISGFGSNLTFGSSD